MTTPDELPIASSKPTRRRRMQRAVVVFAIFAVVYFIVAYILLPMGWRRYAVRHPSLESIPRITYTSFKVPGDPLNVALVGTHEQVISSMLADQWHPADSLTFDSCARIAIDTVFRRPYADAPVSNLYLFGRREDLAFEQPLGDDPKRRHHVRFWKSDTLDSDGRPFWFGSATFDTSVGLSHVTGQITHHISADIDADRARLLNGLQKIGRLSDLYWEDDFHKIREGRNGEGDPWHTDGRLGVGVLIIAPENKSAISTRKTSQLMTAP